MSERVSEKTPVRTTLQPIFGLEKHPFGHLGKIQTCIIFISSFALAKVKRRHGAGEA